MGSMNRWLVFGAMVALLGAGCDGDSTTDGGTSEDAGGIDAGTTDAGSTTDGGTTDGGSEDAGGIDAGMADSGMDAGSQDASTDAGSQDAGEHDAGDGLTGGETCALAFDVTAGGTFVGTTEGADDDYSPSGSGCPFARFSGGDVTYFVRPTAPTTYRVTVVPTNATYDPLLYAVTTCGGSGCVAGTVFNGPGVMEQITFDVDADETVFIVVDGELSAGSAEGPFELTVAIE